MSFQDSFLKTDQFYRPQTATLGFSDNQINHSIGQMLQNSISPNNLFDPQDHHKDAFLYQKRKNYLIQDESRADKQYMPNFRSDKLNVTLEYEGKPKTLFKNIKVTYDASGGILIALLLLSIKDSGFSFKGHVVSYYSHSDKSFVFIGKDPISADFSIMPYELNP